MPSSSFYPRKVLSRSRNQMNKQKVIQRAISVTLASVFTTVESLIVRGEVNFDYTCFCDADSNHWIMRWIRNTLFSLSHNKCSTRAWHYWWEKKSAQRPHTVLLQGTATWHTEKEKKKGGWGAIEILPTLGKFCDDLVMFIFNHLWVTLSGRLPNHVTYRHT